jgi:tRNA-specific 2-thiouridylase
MKNKPKVLLGMSGGVDSSVSAILLQKRGYDVVGITMKLWEDEKFDDCEGGCCNLSSTIDAKRVCDKLGIPHYVLNLKKEFKENVIDDFIEKYLDAKTPNPCVECNRYLKFGYMYKKAQELGIEYIATGHYAKIEFDKRYNRYVMKKSNADRKDQTYALYNIPKEIISKVIFPLGEFESKDEIRKIAEEYGLNVAKKPDSQEICFIPDNNHIRFINENINYKLKPGNIVDRNGKILKSHDGIIKYTIGQRRGLGISSKKPLYVVKLDKEKNEVIVGNESDLYTKVLYANDINNILFDKLDKPINIQAKIRYSAKAANAILYPQEYGTVKVEFVEAQRAVTPGQAVVFYIDDVILGGGKIM